MNNDEANAHKAHHRRKAAQEFNEVIRSNSTGWDDPPMTADQQAYADDAIRRAAQKFHAETYEPYPDISR